MTTVKTKPKEGNQARCSFLSGPGLQMLATIPAAARMKNMGMPGTVRDGGAHQIPEPRQLQDDQKSGGYQQNEGQQDQGSGLRHSSLNHEWRRHGPARAATARSGSDCGSVPF